MEKQNLYKIINEFNKYMQMKPVIKFSMMKHGSLYLKMRYTDETEVPVDEWNKDSIPVEGKVENGVIKNVTNAGVISVWVHRNEKTNEVEFTLWQDMGIYTNSYIMPDKQLAERFYKARSDMAGCEAKLLIGSFDVYVSSKLIAEAIMYLKKQIDQTQKYISKISLNYENYKEGVKRLKDYTNDLNDYIDSLEMLTEVVEKRENK